MFDEHGGSTDDGVRFDMSSENCRVVRHLFSEILTTSEDAKTPLSLFSLCSSFL